MFSFRHYLNPDEMEAKIRDEGFLRFSDYEVDAVPGEALSFFHSAPLLAAEGFAEKAKRLSEDGGRLYFTDVEVNAYFASVAVDFLRGKLMERKASFTFETVMSHPSKVELLANAQLAGYRTYLYYISTDDPDINISRVRSRVRLGGHPVPEDRIVKRYFRSLDLLMDAIRNTNRVYVFDNSGENIGHSWIAEVTEGTTIELKSDSVPAWFQRFVLDKIHL